MNFEPGNASICLVLDAAAGNSSLSEVSKCWGCEEQLGFSDQLLGNLRSGTNCTECLENVCSEFVVKQNWHRSRSMLLVAAFMGILMLFGIPGNMVVLVVYYFKQNKTTANKFMMALASIDLHTCMLIHPYIIFKCFHFYSSATWMCKIFEYLLYVTQGTQGFTLLAVAVDRYYAVFKPLAIGYVENAAYVIPICFGVGAAGSIPMILFYGKKTVWLHDQQKGAHIRTHVCHYSDEYDGSRDQFIYIISTLVLLVLILVVISILYIMIAVKIWKRNAQVAPLGIALVPLQAESANPNNKDSLVMMHSKRNLGTSSIGVRYRNDQSAGDTEIDGRVRNTTSTSLGNRKHGLIAAPNEIDLITTVNSEPIAHCSSTTPPTQNTLSTITVLPLYKSLDVPLSVSDQALRIHKKAVVHPANNTSAGFGPGFKGCRLLFIVTTVFFLSWLPFWVLRFVHDSGKWWENIQFTKALLSHLFFLNNAANPILYVFINRKFREECKMAKKKISIRLRNMCC